MARRVDRKKQNRRQIFWTASAFAVIVLGMTIYDLRFRTSGSAAVPVPVIGDHYIAAASDIAALPDDYSGVTVQAGTLHDGKIETGPHAPQNFAQREVSLVYALPALAEGADDGAVKAIAGDVRHWTRKSNIVTDVVLDIRSLALAPQRLRAMLTQLRDALDREYRVALLIDPLNAKDSLVAAPAEDRKTVYKELVNLAAYADAENAVATINAADALVFPFTLYTPAGSRPDTFAPEAAAKSKYLRKIVPTLGTAPDTSAEKEKKETP